MEILHRLVHRVSPRPERKHQLVAQLVVLGSRQPEIPRPHDRRPEHPPREVGVNLCEAPLEIVLEPQGARTRQIEGQVAEEDHQPAAALEPLLEARVRIVARPGELAVVGFEPAAGRVELLDQPVERFDRGVAVPRREVLERRAYEVRVRLEVVVAARGVRHGVGPGMGARRVESRNLARARFHASVTSTERKRTLPPIMRA
jgi:hypothetical protein